MRIQVETLSSRLERIVKEKEKGRSCGLFDFA
jgi:hypothetical protein